MDQNTPHWNQILQQFPQPSFLQTWEWGQVKARYGWEVDTKIWQDEKGTVQAAALILIREQTLPVIGKKLRIMYVPKGPLLRNWYEPLRKKVLDDLRVYAQKAGAVYIKIDPEIITARGFEGNPDYEPDKSGCEIVQQLQLDGWRKTDQQIQFKNTFWIDLKSSEEDLLAGMKQKTRYNIHLAEKKGVSVRAAGLDDLDEIYRMYAETANRDGFIIRPKEYYLFVWESFMKSGMATPLLAEVEGIPVAGLFLFHFADRSWYVYGMSTSQHREKMPNYLLQWEAIRLSRTLGCRVYDLWGAPDTLSEADRMWGVYRFKEGLGARIIQTEGAFDFPLKRFEYKIIQEALPRILAVSRSIRRRQIQNELTG